MSKHPVVHVELSSSDRQQSAEFYGKVFGWETQHQDEMNYSTFADGAVGGGFNPVTEETPAGSVIIYIGTDDIEASLAAV